MKRTTWFPIALTTSLLFAATAVAGPLQHSHVMQQPAWLLHVDADALRTTTVGQHILTELAKPEAQKKLAAFQAIFNFDPSRALRGVTLYGAAQAEQDAVLLVYADVDVARLTTLAGGAKDHTTSNHRVHVIHAWTDDNRPAKDGVKPRTYAAIHGRTVVFGQQQSRVAEALDVMDGLRPSLGAGANAARLNQPGVFLQGAARKPELPTRDPNAAVFRQASMMTLVAGERQGRVQGSLTLDTDGEEVAAQIEAIGRGILGLMSLRQDNPEAQRLARALSIQRDGASVTAGLSMPAAEVVETMKAGAARRAAKRD